MLDSILPGDPPQRIPVNFPVIARSDTGSTSTTVVIRKRQIAPEDAMHSSGSCSISQLEADAGLPGRTQVSGLPPDPGFEGGGFHEISTGGRLGIHADFRIHEKLHLQRRLNLLIYLNEN